MERNKITESLGIVREQNYRSRLDKVLLDRER